MVYSDVKNRYSKQIVLIKYIYYHILRLIKLRVLDELMATRGPLHDTKSPPR